MHPRLSVDQLCFPGASIAEFADHCDALGAPRVVLTSPGLLGAGGADEALAALDGGPRVEAVNHPFAVHPDLELDDGRAVATLEQLIPVAAELGARSLYLLTGGRGRLDWPAAATAFVELVSPCVDLAERNGMRLMLENCTGLYADIHIAHTLTDTVTIAEAAGLGICVDLQFCWFEGDLLAALGRALPRTGLVQVSDYVLGDRALPGRAVPGDGTIPLDRLVGQLLQHGYDGVFDIELLGPRIDEEGHRAATARAAERMGEILTSLGA